MAKKKSKIVDPCAEESNRHAAFADAVSELAVKYKIRRFVTFVEGNSMSCDFHNVDSNSELFGLISLLKRNVERVFDKRHSEANR